MKVLLQSLLEQKTPFFGTFLQAASPEFVEAAGYAGFSFAAVDLEHAAFGMETAAGLLRAGEAAGLSMLVRVPGMDAACIKKALDAGAAGIIVPNIDTAAQAAEAVALCRFAPGGLRGACPGVRANGYGRGGGEYYETADRETAVLALIESPEGIRNAAEIAAVPGLTAVFLGPIDLSVSMGLKGDLSAPQVRESLLDAIRRIKAVGTPVGALGLDPAFIAKMVAAGLDFFAYGIDTILMYQACAKAADILSQIGRNQE